MNALDNGGGLRAWAKRHPSTTVKSLAGMKERLSARGACDDRTVTKYKKKQAAGTKRVMVESGRALAYNTLHC